MARTGSKAGVVVKRGAGGKFMGSVGNGSARMSSAKYAATYGQEKGLSMSNRQVGKRMRGAPVAGQFKGQPLGQVRAQFATAVRQRRSQSPSALGGESTRYYHMGVKAGANIGGRDTLIQSRAIAKVVNERRAAKKASTRASTTAGQVVANKPNAATKIQTTGKDVKAGAAARRDYNAGWKSSQNFTTDRSGRSPLERADDRGASKHWYQGYEDHASDKRKGATFSGGGSVQRGPSQTHQYNITNRSGAIVGAMRTGSKPVSGLGVAKNLTRHDAAQKLAATRRKAQRGEVSIRRF